VWRSKAGDRRLSLDECPAGFVTAESQEWVLLFLACRTLRTPPLLAGLLDWPARLVDALLLLEQEAQESDG